MNPLTNVAVAVADDGADSVDLYARSSQDENRKVASNLAPAIEQLRGVLPAVFDHYQIPRPAFSGDRVAVRAMFREIRMAISSGTLLLINRQTGGVIFSAPSNNISSGTLQLVHLPAGGAASAVPTNTPVGTAAVPSAPTNGIDGAALYAAKCAGCHGPLASSAKRGRTAAQITAASMTQGLSAAEVQAVADALASTTSTTPPTTPPASPPPTTTPSTTVDGTALYASKCQGCHGPIATSSKRGKTAAQITAANMTQGLSAVEVQAVADALAANTPSTPPPPPTTTPSTGLDGAALYASKCQGCHGPIATSSKRGRAAAQSRPRTYQGLSAAEVQAVAAALASPSTSGTTPTTSPTSLDGAALYAAYCQTCHGSLASSKVKGASASKITSEGMTRRLAPLRSRPLQRRSVDPTSGGPAGTIRERPAADAWRSAARHWKMAGEGSGASSCSPPAARACWTAAISIPAATCTWRKRRARRVARRAAARTRGTAPRKRR